MLNKLKQFELELTTIAPEDEEALLVLAQDYESLITDIKTSLNSMQKSPVFSDQDVQRLFRFNQNLLNKLNTIKNNKFQLLKKIKTGKEMQLSYLSC